MMFYAKIKIERAAQPVQEVTKIVLPDRLLTLADLTKHVQPDQKFSIESDEGLFCTTQTLHVHSQRLETEQELAARVAKEEKYMVGYEAHHAKYPRK